MIAEANQRISQEQPKAQEQIGDTERQLAEIEQAIGNLLDLVERFRVASARHRVAKSEAERARVQVRLRKLERQRDARELAISPKMIKSTLKSVRDALIEGDIRAK